MNYEIKEENQKFALIKDEKEVGFLKYKRDLENDVIIEFIFIEEKYRGEGYAKIIFNKFIKKARRENFKIIPVCPYAQAQFKKRSDIQSFIKKQ